jgi:hypothetical protein
MIVHHHIHNSPPLVPVLSQINPAHAPPPYSLKTHFNTLLQPIFRSSKWSFPWSFLTKLLHETLISPICATHPTHLTLLHFITQIFGKKKELWSSSMCSFLQFPVKSFLLDPDIIRTLLWNTLSPCSTLSVTDWVSHPYTTGIIIVLYILIFILSISKPEYRRFWTKVTITQKV